MFTSRVCVCASVCALLGLGAPALAQCAPWELIAAAGPSPRQNHAMVHDGVGNHVMLFGGYRGGFGFNGETWVFMCGQWVQSPATGPTARANFAMDFDSARDRVVLFGGTPTGSVALDDTWAWDGAAQTWTQLGPPASPSGRFNHAMAYDAAADRMVLFGGFNTVRLSDTWLFDGTNWTQVFPATMPPARSSHAMVYDSARGRVVMFGGFLGGGQWSNQTWEWNGTDWTLSPATGPSGRQYLGMVFDPERAVTVLSCGQAANFVRMDDTWEYNGTSWTQVTTLGNPAPARDQHAMAFCPGGTLQGGHIVIHGGYVGGANVLSDTWRLDCEEGCYPDCNDDGNLTIADFICFQAAVNPCTNYGDCNGCGNCTIADFICFQSQFIFGCP